MKQVIVQVGSLIYSFNLFMKLWTLLNLFAAVIMIIFELNFSLPMISIIYYPLSLFRSAVYRHAATKHITPSKKYPCPKDILFHKSTTARWIPHLQRYRSSKNTATLRISLPKDISPKGYLSQRYHSPCDTTVTGGFIKLYFSTISPILIIYIHIINQKVIFYHNFCNFFLYS